MISVVVPLYRGKQYISRMIDSIERNSNIDGLETEVIFVNDNPQDFFQKADYPSCLKIKFLNHKQNKGIHQTKIDGFQMSEGRYILFLDQDDKITNDYFENQLQKIGKKSAVFCNGYRRQGELIYSAGRMEERSFDLQEYLSLGYPLISLGQLLIRREAVPKGWIENPMKHNGWDDHLFWVCMLQEQCPVAYNDAYLYVHEETGGNASFNWTAMENSGTEFKDKVCGLGIFEEEDKKKFIETIEKRIRKYNKYMELDELIEKVKPQDLQDYLYKNSIYKIAVYGIGVYGKKLCQMLDSQKLCIQYGIDQNAFNKNVAFPVYESIREDIPVDCIICATGFEDEEMKRSMPGKALTFKEILAENLRGVSQ